MTGIANAEIVIAGWSAPAFAPLAAVFARSVAETPLGGAALCVHHRGSPVVDLEGGSTGGAHSRHRVFSVAKAVTAVATHLAHQRGQLDLDQPIGSFWPAFRRPSTRSITTRVVLAHRAGLPAVDRVLSTSEVVGDALERALEDQEPYWEPGSDHGYHTITFGALLDGIFRRALGPSVAEYVAENLARPLDLGVTYGSSGSSNDVMPVVGGAAVTVDEPGEGASHGLLNAAAFGLLDDPTIFNLDRRPRGLAPRCRRRGHGSGPRPAARQHVRPRRRAAVARRADGRRHASHALPRPGPGDRRGQPLRCGRDVAVVEDPAPRSRIVRPRRPRGASSPSIPTPRPRPPSPRMSPRGSAVRAQAPSP
jgi:CubicO group peptidase (beta-lactamase class C family)